MFVIENTLDLKIRTGADPHSVRTLYGKTHVCSMQFSACGNFPDSCKKAIRNPFQDAQSSQSEYFYVSHCDGSSHCVQSIVSSRCILIDCLEATALSSAHSISGARLRWEVLIVVKYPACFPSQLIPKLFHVNCLSSIFYEFAVISCTLRQMGLFAITLAKPNIGQAISSVWTFQIFNLKCGFLVDLIIILP